MLLSAVPVPPKIQLILGGNIKDHHSETQGIYLLVEDFINDRYYWIQRDGTNAIWFQRSWYTSWIVGPQAYLGQNYTGITLPNAVSSWPTQIFGGYEFWDGASWQSSHSNEITIKDCTYEKANHKQIHLANFKDLQCSYLIVIVFK